MYSYIYRLLPHHAATISRSLISLTTLECVVNNKLLCQIREGFGTNLKILIT